MQHLTAIQLRYGGVETLWSGGFSRPAVGAPQFNCVG